MPCLAHSVGRAGEGVGIIVEAVHRQDRRRDLPVGQPDAQRQPAPSSATERSRRRARGSTGAAAMRRRRPAMPAPAHAPSSSATPRAASRVRRRRCSSAAPAAAGQVQEDVLEPGFLAGHVAHCRGPPPRSPRAPARASCASADSGRRAAPARRASAPSAVERGGSVWIGCVERHASGSSRRSWRSAPRWCRRRRRGPCR